MKLLLPVLLACVFGVFATGCQSKSDDTAQKTKMHRCANCGMNTQMAPKWEQTIEMQDGTVYYCGPRCMFKHVLDKQVDVEKISRVNVREYYELKTVDGRKAWYVTGSDILGPMGNELVPFSTEDAAIEFKRDHNGKGVVQWKNVDLELIRELSGKQKMK